MKDNVGISQTVRNFQVMLSGFLILPKDRWRVTVLINGCDIIRFCFLNSHSGRSVKNEVEEEQLLV